MSSSGAFQKYYVAIYMFCFVSLLVGLLRDGYKYRKKDLSGNLETTESTQESFQ